MGHVLWYLQSSHAAGSCRKVDDHTLYERGEAIVLAQSLCCAQVYDILLEAALHGAIYTGPDPEETIAYLRDQAEDALET